MQVREIKEEKARNHPLVMMNYRLTFQLMVSQTMVSLIKTIFGGEKPKTSTIFSNLHKVQHWFATFQILTICNNLMTTSRSRCTIIGNRIAHKEHIRTRILISESHQIASITMTWEKNIKMQSVILLVIPPLPISNKIF